MARVPNFTVQNNFSKGLVTEATGLSFPENACTETENCVFNQFGISKRRLGFDFEDQFANSAQTIEGNVIVTYLWKDVAGNGDRTVVVVQIGDTLHFYTVSSNTVLSANKHANTINLITFAPVGTTTVSNIECQFSAGNGLLFVTNSRLDSFYVKYDPIANTYTGTEIDIQTRDFEGDSADPYAVSERPTSSLAALNASHKYNLENQGWNGTTLAAWDTGNTTMPSNADAPGFFRVTSTGDTAPIKSFLSVAANLSFTSTIIANVLPGNSKSPNGHFIYNLYATTRSANVVGATNYSIDTERVSTSAFFAGRIFYSGLSVQNYSSKIFFSQIIEDVSQYGKAYQSNDPTSEGFFDLLPSDGGVIDLIEAGTIFKLMPVLNSLMVFASNGVWSITGSQGIGFMANDYTVQKISAITNISHTSFVDVEGFPFWWNLEGIHTIKIDPRAQNNAFKVESVTDQTIRSFFLDLPGESKQFARGAYDPFTKTVQWMYRSDTSSSFNEKYIYDRFLNLNLLSGAFYPWSVDNTNVKVHSIVNVFGLSGTFENMDVFDGANDVVDGANDVITFAATNSSTISVIKYLVSYVSSGNKVTFAENYRSTNKDWQTFDTVGVEYDSYFVTGFAVRGQGMRKFQSNYVTILSESSQDSSFRIRGQWNYSIVPDSGRWTTEQVLEIVEEQTQTFSLVSGDGFSYKPKRVKIRGHGLACQFKISNNGTDPFFIVGWTVFETGNKWI